jgi:molybdenum cofactor cytidylyltransferase
MREAADRTTNPARPASRGIIEGIVLAAGLSTRMGQAKLAIEIDGITLLDRVVGAALDSRLERVIVVLGPSQQVPRPQSRKDEGPRLRIARNPSPERGMSSSLRTGLAEVSSSASGVMTLLADQPWLTPMVIDTLIDSFHRYGDKIVAPEVHGRRSNPVVIPRRLFGELEEVTGDAGGRSVLNRHSESVVLIKMSSFYDDTDLDTPEDLAAARERIRRKETTDR